METSEVAAELLEKLTLIGPKGRAASRDLEAARRHQENGEPRVAIGRGVSAHIRGALDALLSYADPFGDSGAWRQVSRAVVGAKDNYDRSIESADGDASKWLDELMGLIEEQRAFHQNEESRTQKRAVALIVRLKGAKALVDDPAPAKQIADLRGKASEYIHKGCTEDRSRELLVEVEEVLWTAFRPPDLPGARLAALAQQEDPSDEVIREVNELLASARDLEAFLELVPTPAWLQKLNRGTRSLDPPGQPGSPWIARGTVVRLSRDYREEAVEWVMEIAGRHREDPVVSVSLTSVLLDMRPPAISEALKVAKCHPNERMLLLRIVDALRDSADPSSILVKDAADLFLSDLLQGREDSNPTLQGGLENNYYMALLGMLSDGATPDNAADRLEMLSYKLEIAHRHWQPPAWYRGMAEMFGYPPDEMPSDLWMLPLGYSPDAPIRRLGERDLEDFGMKAVSAIVASLVRIFQSAVRWLPVSTLLKLAAQAPEPLGHRLEVWVLSEVDEADPEAMVRTIESAVATRLPNCDDVALIDRVMSLSEGQDKDITGHVNRWRAAMGAPPSLAEAAQAIGSASTWVGYSWFCSYHWAPLLPDTTVSTWISSEGFQLLTTKLPPRGRAKFGEIANKPHRSERTARNEPPQLPLNAAELGSMTPADAAKKIASYTVAQDQWVLEALRIGSVLQGLIKASPSTWGDDPTRIVELLSHPTYISHYLTGFSGLDTEHLSHANIDGLVNTIVRVLGEPRLVEEVDGETACLDNYAGDWDEVRRAAIWLVRQLLVTEVGLAGRYQEVWYLLESEAKAVPQSQMFEDDMKISPVARPLCSDGQQEPEFDPHYLAINQQNIQALDTALLLAVHEHKANSQIRPQVTALIEWCLGISGAEGAKCRSVIAPRAGFLLYALPDWLEVNKDRLFGNDVLGQIALDQVLRFTWPYEWMCINFRSEIYDAAHRGVDRSLDWILVAMLNSTKGYEPESVIEQLDTRVPKACRVLARLLNYPSTDEDTSDERADRFFELLLERKEHARSLGYLAWVETMPHDRWAALTFRAMKATDGEIEMSELIIRRVFNNQPTEDSIRILKSLIEVQCNPDHVRLVEDASENSEHLNRAIWDRATIAEEAPRWLEQSQCTDASSDASRQLLETLRRHGLLRDTT